MSFQKVEDVNRPLKVGETFLVPCIIYKEEIVDVTYDEQKDWMDFNPTEVKRVKTFITPVINHPHSDKENGQNEVHYHADFRFIRVSNFIEDDKGNLIGFPKQSHSSHIWGANVRPLTDIDIKWVLLPVVNERPMNITPVEMISKSKLKYKCIHKGKCPHRGYDLSQEANVDGVITCPLHGLKFDSKTKNLLN
jgi:hypothetical protein